MIDVDDVFQGCKRAASHKAEWLFSDGGHASSSHSYRGEPRLNRTNYTASIYTNSNGQLNIELSRKTQLRRSKKKRRSIKAVVTLGTFKIV